MGKTCEILKPNRHSQSRVVKAAPPTREREKAGGRQHHKKKGRGGERSTTQNNEEKQHPHHGRKARATTTLLYLSYSFTFYPSYPLTLVLFFKPFFTFFLIFLCFFVFSLFDRISRLFVPVHDIHRARTQATMHCTSWRSDGSPSCLGGSSHVLGQNPQYTRAHFGGEAVGCSRALQHTTMCPRTRNTITTKREAIEAKTDFELP